MNWLDEKLTLPQENFRSSSIPPSHSKMPELARKTCQFFKTPTRTTSTPSARRYAYCPTPVSTIMKDGSFIFAVSITLPNLSRLFAPSPFPRRALSRQAHTCHSADGRPRRIQAQYCPCNDRQTRQGFRRTREGHGRT